jgi:hypothetical protein
LIGQVYAVKLKATPEVLPASESFDGFCRAARLPKAIFFVKHL